MQIQLARPITHEKAPNEQYSSMFVGFRAHLGVGVYNYDVPNIPKYWVVYVNPESPLPALVQVETGPLNVILPRLGHIKTPGRSTHITITVFVGDTDLSVYNLGDDDIAF
jgi:hypothetical protein